jgi:hypothetical protein
VRSLLYGELGDTRAIQPCSPRPIDLWNCGSWGATAPDRYPAAERLNGLRQMKAPGESIAGESIFGDWITKAS